VRDHALAQATLQSVPPVPWRLGARTTTPSQRGTPEDVVQLPKDPVAASRVYLRFMAGEP
jgi:hypothetical protein